MPIINPTTGAKVAEIEGGEAILSKSTVSNNRPLVMALLNSSMHQNGKPIAWQQRPYTPINFSGISQSVQNLKYAAGGIFANNQNNTQASPVQQVIVQSDDEMKQMMLELISTNRKLHTRLDMPINADVSLYKIADAVKIDKNRKSEAGAGFTPIFG